MRWFGILPLLLLAACSTERQYTITVTPVDANISVDNGAAQGQGQVIVPIVFKNGGDVHTAIASRAGYQELAVDLRRDDPSTTVAMALQPAKRRLNFSVSPVAGMITVDGVPLAGEPVLHASTERAFALDSNNQWTQYTVVASREGWDPATITVTSTDASPDYVLQLRPKRKDLTIATTPSGASVALDGQAIGTSPAAVKGVVSPYDNNSNQYLERKVTVTKPGYEPVSATISWDDGKSDYAITLPAHAKVVRVKTDPPGATVTIDGKPAEAGPDGVATANLVFTPVNDKGDLPVFNAVITKKTADSEWFPTTLPIAWDDGRGDYSVALRQIITRQVPLLGISTERNSDGVWEILPRTVDTLAMKDTGEGSGKEPAALLYQAPNGSSIGTLCVSPDGTQILFTLLSGSGKADFRSQILSIGTSGPGAVREITDGKTLDLMPSFTPDGNQIVYVSNLAGRRLNIFRRSFNDATGIEQLTRGEEQDLWPMIDAAPKPRLFYQVLSDSQSDPQLYSGPVDGVWRTNLTTIPVFQPRISPRADTIVFTSVNQHSGKRQLYSIPDRGGPTVDLTNDPDSNCYDPAWSKDGSLIAYVSDRSLASYPVLTNGQVTDERHHNPDIWILDLAHPDKPIQVTSNASVDDCPAWDPSGNSIYFRSNRGGQWGIWKIAVK